VSHTNIVQDKLPGTSLLAIHSNRGPVS